MRPNLWNFLCFLFSPWFSSSLEIQPCSIKRSSAQNISKWSDGIMASQNHERIENLFDPKDIPEIRQKVNKFHEISTKVQSNSCKVYKKFAGRWIDGFLDGEKLICMDSLYHAILNGTCLVYSYGLSDDWDFEIMMANLGCQVHAYDPTDEDKRPEDSYHPNIHYHEFALSHGDGVMEIATGADKMAEYPTKTLKSCIKDNGDLGKRISYLKIDIENSELACYKQWIKSNVMSYVDQLGIEWHTGPHNIIKKYMKSVYTGLIEFNQKLHQDYGLDLVAYNPNLYQGKATDGQRIYYPFFDVLFVKKAV